MDKPSLLITKENAANADQIIAEWVAAHPVPDHVMRRVAAELGHNANQADVAA